MTRPTLADAHTLPLTLPLYDEHGGPDFAKVWGVGRTSAYRMAARGELPVAPLRLSSGRIVVPTAPLLAALGIDVSTNDEAPARLGAAGASVATSGEISDALRR